MAFGLSDIKRGVRISVEGEPYVVMFTKHVHMGRGSAVLQTKIKNLRTGKIFERNFKPGDDIKEADINRMTAQFIYEKNGEFWFHEAGNPSNRFELDKKILGDQALFLKQKMEVTALIFKDEIINVELPVKAEYKVLEAPPSIKGNTSGGGNKVVTIEGGAKINVPLFIEEGDIIRVNTDTGEYTERAK